MNNISFVGEHPRTYSVHPHAHDHWELVYCTGGSGSFTFRDGVTVNYAQGDMVAIPPRTVHANVSQEGFTNIHLIMDEPTFPYHHMFKITDDSDGRIRMAFEQARYYYLADIRKRELVLTAIGELIAAYVVVYRSNNDFSEPVELIRTEILKRYSEPEFALDVVIRAMPFHYDYLRKLFKKEVGITPLEYLTGMRMKKAEALLNAMRSEEYSITEIAQMCGFDDPLYFSRVFKKNFGCSPTGYVRNLENSSPAGRTEPDREPYPNR